MLEFEKIERIDIGSKEFPDKLRNIPNPPQQLYCVGNIGLLNQKSIGVVGSRKFTMYGKGVAQMVGRRLAQSGVPVVSGLASGIDAYAHQGVVEANGKGIAVLGSGVKMMSPIKNRPLMWELLEAGGLLLSEYEPERPAEPYTFPERNRIISGLSHSLIVVEANHNSGALITAQHANEQGRQVYAVPGNINSQFSLGSNLLIRDGATPLIVVDDVIRDMGAEIAVSEEIQHALGEVELKIYNEVRKYNGVTPDRVAAALNMRVAQVNAIATVLEIKGVLEIYAGKLHLAKPI
ncbi:MAG: DNA-processing protein DprA [Clostridiales bacterium]|nr:DNA-processing protein DprA [Candidatus Crickella equi]